MKEITNLDCLEYRKDLEWHSPEHQAVACLTSRETVEQFLQALQYMKFEEAAMKYHQFLLQVAGAGKAWGIQIASKNIADNLAKLAATWVQEPAGDSNGN